LIISGISVFTITPDKDYMLVGLLLVLVLTILFRPIFCGWVCPLGTVFDLIRSFGEWLGNKSLIRPFNRRYKWWVKNNQITLHKIDHYARYLRYVFLLWILQAAFLGIASIKNGDERGIVTALYLLIALAIIGLFVQRSWCKYACPVGAILGVFSGLSPTSITRNAERCIDCHICSRICPMTIDVANLSRVCKIDCQTCIKCIEACPVDNALELKFQTPTLFKINRKVKDAVSSEAGLPHA